MAVRDELFKWKEQFEGIVDPQEFYKLCYEVWTDALKYDVFEEEHKYVAENSKKKWYWKWKIEKDFDEFVSCESYLEVELEYEEKEGVLPTGERVKVKKGSGKVGFKGVLKKDFDKLGKGGIAGVFRKIFEEIFYKPTYKKWKKILKSDSLTFREKIREYVGGIT